MENIYKNICEASKSGKKHLAVLIDPDKFPTEKALNFIQKVNRSFATHIFVGGSTVSEHETDTLVAEIKKHTTLPIVLFPGDVTQITEKADGLLFLSLISGRNPDYLIGKHVEAVAKLHDMPLEIIPTGYILIENGKETTVQRVTETQPISRNRVQYIIDTAKAGALLGMKLIYLEAGSGALHPITPEIIKRVKKELKIPLIVGGGIKKREQLKAAFNSGADMVVVGTAFEEDEGFFDDLNQ
ncbi:geranylgeranylglyceryl/heptaprenylglyceryl phosphate synthase [Flavobacteriaceae bacterium GSB9]|nr:geranylgeranylglyceryl/heptaprenylglyceryl phosphate synthase [Flavobacteriaceae bacterium GSB9]